MAQTDDDLSSIAVIGMALRLPGARDLEQFWANIAGGVDSIASLDEAKLRRAGIAESVLADPRYVKRASMLDDIEGFDAAFFDMLPSEAQITDPQHRLLLECAYEAVEHAGYDPFALDVPVGVYAGVGISDYLIANLCRGDFPGQHDALQVLIGNDKSYACTRISHKLNLTGPCVAVDTACSTSLVAVHEACKSLLLNECDMALAGGARVVVPHGYGYRYQPGSVLAPDGVCRPFDAQAGGTVQGSGAGMVLLKRLADAVRDGDCIHAVIRGSAVNNDGSNKMGYTAPGVTGQARVIAQALLTANVPADSIAYIEAHGTGTRLGDPIELEALRKAYRQREKPCAIGSVKGNLGHLDVAAGVAGLIKTILALEHGYLPPSIHYSKPNPDIDFGATPFYVNETLTEWPRDARPRRAAVSSFGIGGTNAHVILERRDRDGVERVAAATPRVFSLSARSPRALEEMRARLVRVLRRSNVDLPDAAYTLAVGRPKLAHRIAVVAAERDELIAELGKREKSLGAPVDGARRIAFLFTGQGSQYVGMCRAFYERFDAFRACLDEMATLMRPHLPCSLQQLLWEQEWQDRLNETRYTQPALFAIEYSLATLWRSFGVVPTHVLGHSVGEIAAACFAGVFSLKDGVEIVCARGSCMQELGGSGGMLAIMASEDEVARLLREDGSDLEIAAVNGPRNVVVSGLVPSIERFAGKLTSLDIVRTRLQTLQAFHSRAMDRAKGRFKDAIAGIEFRSPHTPVISNARPRAAESDRFTPDYWAEQIREPVRFMDGIHYALEQGVDTFIEIGPSATLSKLGMACQSRRCHWLHSDEPAADSLRVLLGAVAKLYELGAEVQVQAPKGAASPRRIPLPTYAFERTRHWALPEDVPPLAPTALEPQRAAAAAGDGPAAPRAAADAVGPDVKQRIAALWSELLAVAPIQDGDDFFALGGHSLLIVQLHERIERTFGVSPPLSTLMENSTLREFAAAIEHLLAGETPAGDVPVGRADQANLHEPFPLVELQQAYLLGRSPDFDLGGVATHLYFEARPRNLDFARFEKAVAALIARHDMLRAVVCNDHEQRILRDPGQYSIRRYDLVQRGDELAVHLQTVRRQMSHQVLPANRWPLFDIRVTTLSQDESIVHFSLDMLMLDATSNRVLMRDIELLYAGRDDLLPKLPISYRDYVIARNEARKLDAYAAAKEYWLRRIPDMPLAPELPVAAPGAAQRERSFSRRLKIMDERTTLRLKDRAKGMAVTPSVLLLTAYGLVLAYWSRRPAFTISLSIGDRLPVHECINDVVGEFSTLSLLTMDFGRTESFKEHARAVQRQLWRDYEHKAFNGVEVLRELSRAHRGERTALMPVVFTSALPLEQKSAPRDTPEPVFLVTEDDHAISQTPQVWIDHFVTEEAGRLVLSWDCLEGAFPDGVLDDMFAAYTGLVRDLAEDSAAWQRERLELLPQRQAEARSAITHKNDRARVPATLPALFAAQAAARPDALAVVDGDVRLTYRELDAQCRSWAQYLVEREVAAGDLVAVVMEKGWEQVVAAIAIQTAGAAYVPIDARLPAKRLELLLESTQARHAFTQQQHLDALAWPDRVTPVAIRTVAHAAPPPLDVRARASDLAYVIYTSGSTGTPKGVMITHEAAVNTVLDVNERFAVRDSDRVLALSSLSFDLSVYDIFGTLAAGGVIVLPEGDVADAGRLHDVVRRHEVTVLNAVPALIQLLVDHVEAAATALPPSVRLVMMSGDWIPVGLPQRISDCCEAPLQVISLGGATEAAIWSIFHAVTQVKPSWKSIPYGTPLTNQSVHVLRHDMTPSPDGVPGELFIGGAGLAQGYWQDREKTQARFVVHPKTGERLYRTGDLGRYSPDGSIEFLGREDFQVKINGFRVELGEIESVLAARDDVKQAVVTVKEGGDGGKSLVAYVVARGNASHADDAAFVERLAQACRDSLPSYMIPQLFVPLRGMPLTANGKVDYRALPIPRRESRAAAQPAPLTELERFVCGFLEEMLDAGPVGVQDDFFKIGGHSLIAARLVTRVRETYGATVPLRLVFDHPLVGDLAAALGKALEAGTALPPLRAGTDRDALPLSYAQQRLWFVHELEKDVPGYAAAYNMPVVWRIRGELDVERLRRCLQRILDEHAVLRTTFHRESGKPVLTVREGAALPWAHVNLATSDRPADRYRRELDRIIDTPFNLAAAPLLNAALFQWGPAEFSLVVNMHHIVTDAWSTAVLAESLEKLYAGAELDGGSAHNTLRHQYQDYARWQRQVWDEGLMQPHEDYWLEKLANLPAPLSILGGPKQNAEKSHVGEALPFVLDSETAAALKDFAAANGLTPFAVLLAAFKLLLHFYSGETDLVVGTDTANRDPKETEAMIGYFINQVAIRTKVTGEMPVDEFLQGLRTAVLEAFEHQAMPFDRLLEKLKLLRDAKSSPLFQYKLNYHSVAESAPRMAGSIVEQEEVPRNTVHYDAVLTFRPIPDGLLGTLQYRKNALPRAAMEELVANFCHLLAQLVRGKAKLVRELDYQSPDARARRLGSMRALKTYAIEETLDRTFRRTAARHPQSVALSDDAGQLTYEELDRQTNRLARALACNGVKPGDYVGLYLDRGRQQVIAILAVLKAGAAYVPLDVRWPNERIRLVLGDIRPRLIVTDDRGAEAGQWERGDRAQIWQNLMESEADDSALGVRHSADFPAYVLYTSGSTGRPKGVLIGHAHVQRLFAGAQESYGFDADDVWLLFHSYVFDVSVWEMWGAFTYGGRLVTISHADVRSPERVAQVIGTEGVTVLNQTPSAFAGLSALLSTHEAHRATTASLRWIVFAGEKLDVATLRQWYDAHPQNRARLVNMYGITETTVHTTFRRLEPADAAAGGSPIGRGLPDLEVYVLDRNLAPVPEGVAGEIYVGGPGVALGYINDPARTAEKMVPNPFSSGSSRLYRSGDLAKWSEGGQLEYVGRRDDQIKIRGFRVELGEVESCLRRHEKVMRALVRAEDDGNGGLALIAYWQSLPGAAVAESELRRWLRSHLPEYMLPAAYVAVADFALTTSGKIDRSKLPRRGAAASAGAAAQPFVQATTSSKTETEAALGAIVCELLQRSSVEADDNFFEIGGHSLLTTQLQARVNEAFFVNLPLQTIFDADSIKQLAAEIDLAQDGALAADVLVGRSFSTEGKEEFRL